MDHKAHVGKVYSRNWLKFCNVFFFLGGGEGGGAFSRKGAQDRGPFKKCLNFFVQPIQKQLKKLQNMNTETNKEEKGNWDSKRL